MSFLKHVGKHGDRKVAILFRTVPNEDHMCLVIYPDTIPAAWHDTIMKVLESDVGQHAEAQRQRRPRRDRPRGRPPVLASAGAVRGSSLRTSSRSLASSWKT